MGLGCQRAPMTQQHMRTFCAIARSISKRRDLYQSETCLELQSMASSRIDAADIARLKEYKPISCGFPGGFHEKYDVGEKDIGKGGFGIVRIVTKRQNGKQYAAKSIKKGLDIPNLSIARQAAHLANIKREVSVLHRLRGTLNVVHFYEALEDDEYVHIIMELCTGGELSHSLATRHYSEKTVCCVSSKEGTGVLFTC